MKRASLLLAVFLVSGCSSLQRRTAAAVPPVGKLVEIENRLGVGISYVRKDGVCLVREYQGPGLGDWTLIIVPDNDKKSLLSDIFYSAGHCARAPKVMTLEEYSSFLLAAPPARPVDPGDYQTPEQRIIDMAEVLKRYPALIYRYIP